MNLIYHFDGKEYYTYYDLRTAYLDAVGYCPSAPVYSSNRNYYYA